MKGRKIGLNYASFCSINQLYLLRLISESDSEFLGKNTKCEFKSKRIENI
jgi:hypothetical protein